MTPFPPSKVITPDNGRRPGGGRRASGTGGTAGHRAIRWWPGRVCHRPAAGDWWNVLPLRPCSPTHNQPPQHFPTYVQHIPALPQRPGEQPVDDAGRERIAGAEAVDHLGGHAFGSFEAAVVPSERAVLAKRHHRSFATRPLGQHPRHFLGYAIDAEHHLGVLNAAYHQVDEIESWLQPRPGVLWAPKLGAEVDVEAYPHTSVSRLPQRLVDSGRWTVAEGGGDAG